MNLLHVVSHFPYPATGGLEAGVYNLSIEQARLGDTVVIIAPAELRRNFESEGVRILGVPSWFVADHFYLPKPSSVKPLLKHLKWADVVHIHSPHNTFSQVSIILAQLEGKSVVLSVQSHTTLLRHPRIIGKLGGLVLEPIAQVLIRFAAAAHVENSLDQALVSRVNRRTVRIPAGVRDVFFNQRKSPGSFKEKMKVRDAYPIVLYLGRLHPMKGPQEVIKMLPGLIKRYPSALAVIAEPGPGSGDFGDRLVELARTLQVSEHVVMLTGGMDAKKRISVIDDATVVAVPSLSDSTEAFSITTSEAWARGKPVVAFPVGALRARIRNGINGYLASSIETDSLMAATINALGLKTISLSPDVVRVVDTAREFEMIYRTVRRRNVERLVGS